MNTTSRNGVNPNRPGVDINGERYWLVKIKHKSTGRTKWVWNYGYGKDQTKPMKNYCSNEQFD